MHQALPGKNVEMSTFKTPHSTLISVYFLHCYIFSYTFRLHTYITTLAVVYCITIHCALLRTVNIMFTLSGGEGVYLPGLYYGGLSDQLHCEFGNVNPKMFLL